MTRFVRVLPVTICLAPLVGCVTFGRYDDPVVLKKQAWVVLQTSLRFPDNPVVRVQAVEAFRRTEDLEAYPWIRSAVLDDEPAVRFAALVAIGELQDVAARTIVAEQLEDGNASVRSAAVFALHRLGDSTRTGQLATLLLTHADPETRRNAAMLLGLLGEPSAVRVLARALNDVDRGVRNHALEAMAKLGNADARHELLYMTTSGIGADEVFALQGLAATGASPYVETFRFKLRNGYHVETRLAAAAALARHGDRGGLELALRSLRVKRAATPDPNDPPDQQVLRIRQMAAATLGVLGQQEVLPELVKLMGPEVDPRLRVSAARAILEILNVRPGIHASGTTGTSRPGA